MPALGRLADHLGQQVFACLDLTQPGGVVAGARRLEEAELISDSIKRIAAAAFSIAHATLELESAERGDRPECVPDAQRHVSD